MMMLGKIVKSGSACLVVACLVFSSCNTSSTNAEKPKTDTVSIAAMAFTPADLMVNKGDTVLFINNDIVPHDATEVPDKTWGSPTLNPGDSWRFVPVKSADYYCSIHLVMKGKITVK